MIVDRDHRSLATKRAGDSGADPAARSRHQGDTTIELSHESSRIITRSGSATKTPARRIVTLSQKVC